MSFIDVKIKNKLLASKEAAYTSNFRNGVYVGHNILHNIRSNEEMLLIKEINLVMTVLRKSESAKYLAGIAILGMIAFSFAFAVPQAQALTQSEVDIICTLVGCDAATKTALQALVSGGSTGASYTFTSDLTVGSTGESVRQLQMFLNSNGYTVAASGVGSAGNETTYFGSLTAAALAKYQAANGIAPAVGYFGPITRASVNSMTSGSTGSTGSTGSETLSGGAGSVSTYTKSSSWVNEEVGEDEEDVTVVGIDIEADESSDLEIRALKIDFDDEGTANNSADLDKYVDNVTVWFDGEKVAELDSDEFNDDNNYGTTVALDKGVIIKAGDKETIQVAVSGVNNLDSSDAGDSWNVDIESVRWTDAQGTTIAEDPSITETKFTVETFATATDVEFKIKGADRADINDARIIDVHATSETDNVDVFAFDVEVKGNSDLFVDDLTVEATVTSASDLYDMADQARLYMDGEEVDKVSITDGDDTVTFDDLDLDLEAGETYEFVVALDFRSTGSTLDEGDTVSFTIGETETNLGTASTDIRDENGDQLADADKTGSASSDAHATHDVFIDVELVGSPSITVLDDGAGGTDDDRVTMAMTFDVTAHGGTVYVGDTVAATTATTGSEGTGAATAAIVYKVTDSGEATTDDLSTDIDISYSDPLVSDSTDNIKIEEGGTARITLTVTQVSDTAEDDGIYRMVLSAIYWGVADDTTYEYRYNYSLADTFRTGTAYAD